MIAIQPGQEEILRDLHSAKHIYSERLIMPTRTPMLPSSGHTLTEQRTKRKQPLGPPRRDQLAFRSGRRPRPFLPGLDLGVPRGRRWPGLL